MNGRKPVFRQEALERLSSPERLDQLVQIVKPGDWIVFILIAIFLAAALCWSIYGRLPLVVHGQGIIVQKSKDNSGEAICRSWFPIREGARVRPGMRAEVVPDSVKREQYGAIVGTVREVLTLPVSRSAVVSSLEQDADLAELLLPDSPCIEVIIQLENDSRNAGGFHWTASKGPGGQQAAPGSTSSVRVTVEQKAPISYLLPFLRSASGIQ